MNHSDKYLKILKAVKRHCSYNGGDKENGETTLSNDLKVCMGMVFVTESFLQNYHYSVGPMASLSCDMIRGIPISRRSAWQIGEEPSRHGGGWPLGGLRCGVLRLFGVWKNYQDMCWVAETHQRCDVRWTWNDRAKTWKRERERERERGGGGEGGGEWIKWEREGGGGRMFISNFTFCLCVCFPSHYISTRAINAFRTHQTLPFDSDC